MVLKLNQKNPCRFSISSLAEISSFRHAFQNPIGIKNYQSDSLYRQNKELMAEALWGLKVEISNVKSSKERNSYYTHLVYQVEVHYDINNTQKHT